MTTSPFHHILSALLLILSLLFIASNNNLHPFIPFVVLIILLYFFDIIWFNPRRIWKKLGAQGIKGPKPSILYGNAWEMRRIQANSAAVKKSCENNNTEEFVAHDYTSTLFPYFEQWRKEYGQIYTYSTGEKQHLYIADPQIVKEMNHCISSDLGKPSYITKRLAPMLGNGILRSNGHLWAQQRKIVAPEFFMDKVKGMVGLMLESAESLTSKWEGYIESQCSKIAEMNVEDDLRSTTADVISKACFGSSYLKGKEIFSKLRALQKLISTQSFILGFQAFGFLSSGEQKKIQYLEKEIESLIWQAVKERDRTSDHVQDNRDLLQMIMEGAINNDINEDSSKRLIVDNCKNIYFAGHESTAVAASWCLMLLAMHPQWQDRIRAEMEQIFGATGKIEANSVHKLKTVTMVIQEVLRLYPPAAFVSREALQETRIGDIVVPKGVCLWTLIPTLHRDPEIWGPDVKEFNPGRFANGICNACKVPQAYIPFGIGPRLCLGKNFALVQLKIMIALIVSNFTFSLSPKYRHCPAYRMIVEPAQGVCLILQKRNAAK